MVVSMATIAGHSQLQITAAFLNGELKDEKLVEREMLPCLLRIPQLCRKVQGLQRLGSTNRVPVRPRGTRLLDRGSELFQGLPDQPAQPPLGQPFGECVNWHDAIQVNGNILVTFDDFCFWMVDCSR